MSRAPVGLRAGLIGLACVLVLCGITPYNDNQIGATFIAGNHFPIGALLILLLLSLVAGPLWRKLRGSRPPSAAEMVAVWSMITVASGIPSSGLMRYLVPHIIAPRYYASPENGWERTVLPRLPKYLWVDDEASARWFFEGLPGGQALPWGHWLTPMLAWTVFTLGMYVTFVSLSVLVRRQWVEYERFTFPLVQLPVEMVAAPDPGRSLNALYRNRLLWIAVLLITVIRSLNGVHKFIPAVPEVPLNWPLNEMLRERPWSYAAWMNATIYPLVVGFSYLLSGEVCLSLWLFYLLYKLQCVLGGALGLNMPGVTAGYGSYLFAAHEEAGAAVALAFWCAYVARGHLRRVWESLAHGRSAQDAAEPLPYRLAALGFLAGLAIMLLWLVQVGVSPLVAILDLALALTVFLVLSWMVNQAGLLFLQPTFAGSEVLANLFGSRVFTVRSLLMLSLTEHVYFMDLREFLLPSLLNMHRIADDVRLNRRSMLLWAGLAIVASLGVSSWAAIRLPYYGGGGVTMTANAWTYIYAPQIPFRWCASLAALPHPASAKMALHFVGGGLGMLGLLVLRTRATWFAMHPIGFIIASGYPMGCLWFSIFLGWLGKVVITRYGGLSGYRALKPLFLGLVIGDCLNGAAWIVVGLFTRVGYPILPL
ncbi:MAG: hypothetical protein FJX74_13135 [Armatimonadetes bacterium]|nr:hypothetical protein [Armatimonadota bacterium]